MSSRTFITRVDKPLPGFKSSKDKLILLLEANEVGDMKLKPVLISHFPNPRDLKNCTNSTLPVLSNWNNKPWRTAYLDGLLLQKKKNTPFKIWLLIDKASGHPRSLMEMCKVNVVLSLMQWTWTWANSGRWLGRGRHGMQQSMGSQRVRHNWVTEQQHNFHTAARGSKGHFNFEILLFNKKYIL